MSGNMKPHWILAIALVATILICVPVADSRIVLRPMSVTEVYRALRNIGQEDIVPEGRVVTQGLSVLTGFGLGLAKGIGGTLLVGLATSGMNTSALTSLLSGGNRNRGSGSVQTQEICFDTRSLNDINDEDEPEGKQAIVTATTGGTAPTNTQTMTADGNTGTVTRVTSPAGTTATAPGTTGSTAPTVTNTKTGTNTGTAVNTGTGTGTNSATTTQTDPGSTSCIVIEKPVRKRRSVS